MSDPHGHDHGCGCDPELIFEFADEGLDPERERGIRAHLGRCAGCRELYERELDLNTFLGSIEFSEPRAVSVSRRVAMAVPTRPVKVRVLWALLAGALLLVALLALEINGAAPVITVFGALEAFWGLASGSAGVVRAFLAVAGPLLLISLGVGALLDLLIAVAVLSASRRARRA